MCERIITGLMLVVAVIHLLPISGFFGVERLATLYEIEITDSNLEILMRHRAILFGILGGFLAYAAFTPAHNKHQPGNYELIHGLALIVGVLALFDGEFTRTEVSNYLPGN